MTLRSPVSGVVQASSITSPGMAVSAEIKTGQRRLIEYLLSPLSTTTSESMRER